MFVFVLVADDDESVVVVEVSVVGPDDVVLDDDVSEVVASESVVAVAFVSPDVVGACVVVVAMGVEGGVELAIRRYPSVYVAVSADASASDAAAGTSAGAASAFEPSAVASGGTAPRVSSIATGSIAGAASDVSGSTPTVSSTTCTRAKGSRFARAGFESVPGGSNEYEVRTTGRCTRRAGFTAGGTRWTRAR
jgi:hypothetical protein